MTNASGLRLSLHIAAHMMDGCLCCWLAVAAILGLPELLDVMCSGALGLSRKAAMVTSLAISVQCSDIVQSSLPS